MKSGKDKYCRISRTEKQRTNWWPPVGRGGGTRGQIQSMPKYMGSCSTWLGPLRTSGSDVSNHKLNSERSVTRKWYSEDFVKNEGKEMLNGGNRCYFRFPVVWIELFTARTQPSLQRKALSKKKKKVENTLQFQVWHLHGFIQISQIKNRRLPFSRVQTLSKKVEGKKVKFEISSSNLAPPLEISLKFARKRDIP